MESSTDLIFGSFSARRASSSRAVPELLGESVRERALQESVLSCPGLVLIKKPVAQWCPVFNVFWEGSPFKVNQPNKDAPFLPKATGHLRKPSRSHPFWALRKLRKTCPMSPLKPGSRRGLSEGPRRWLRQHDHSALTATARSNIEHDV